MLRNLADLQDHFSQQLDLAHYLPENLQNLNLVLPGDLITSEKVNLTQRINNGYIHGHGTFEENGSIYSALVGTVQKTNRLLIVNPIKSKYTPSVGDIVIGPVLEISNKRWKIGIASENECFLHLNSTYLPEQRKKTEEDELNMRSLFKEGDLICAEVHSINNDKTINLHTRSLKYGKLYQGALISVNSKQIKRQKHHFCKISNSDVHVIMAHNGNLWFSDIDRNQTLNTDQETLTHKPDSFQIREQVARIRNIAKLLSQESLDITFDKLDFLYNSSKQIACKDILNYNRNKTLVDTLKQQVETKIPQELNKLQKQGVYMSF